MVIISGRNLVYKGGCRPKTIKEGKASGKEHGILWLSRLMYFTVLHIDQISDLNHSCISFRVQSFKTCGKMLAMCTINTFQLQQKTLNLEQIL